MVLSMDELIYYIISAIGGTVAGLIYYLGRKTKDPVAAKVISILTEQFLDEKMFTIERVSELSGLPREVVERVIVDLEKTGAVMRTGKGYSLVDPLVFLTPRDYSRALRLTKSDNIIYGGYQLFYVASPIVVLILSLVMIIPVTIFVLTVFNFEPVISMLNNITGGKIDPMLFSLLIVGIGIIAFDLIDNIVKAFNRSRYMVVVGFQSGLLYDLHPADELSGRVTRGEIERIDVDMNIIHKLNNWFGSTPAGDVRVWVRGKDKPIVFRSMPYPRELFLVLRSIQLGSLQWRKKYARELALWRGRVYPFFPTERGRGRGR